MLLIALFGLLLFLEAVPAWSLSTDTHTGFPWGPIGYVVGGNAAADAAGFGNAYQDGVAGRQYGSVPNTTSAITADVAGNLFFATGGSVYVLYRNTASVPALLAAVNSAPVQNAVYQVANTGVNPSCAPNSGTLCVDASTATAASFSNIVSMSFGPDGNLYVVDQGAYAVRRLKNVNSHGNLDTSVATIAGQLNTQSSTSSDGSGGPATATTFFTPTDLKIDANGNLYVMDYYLAIIQVVYAAAVAPAATPVVPPILTAEGVTPQANSIYTVAGQLNNYCATGGPCTTDGPASGVQLDAANLAIDTAGNLFFDDAYNNFIDVIYAGGEIPPILKAQVGSNVVAGNAYTIAGQPFTPCATAPCGDRGSALQAQLTTSPGGGTMFLDARGDLFFSDSADYSLREVDASGYISAELGVSSPNGSQPNFSGLGGPPKQEEGGGSPFAVDGAGDLFFVAGGFLLEAAVVVPAKPQVVDFPQVASFPYGAAPATLYATGEDASTKAPTGATVTYKVTSGPGLISGDSLVATGAGTVVISATAASNSAYNAATASISVQVNPAPLTVQANHASRAYGQPNPAFTASYAGFVGSDTAATSLTGAPAFSTTAIANSGVGTYPINVSGGTLASTSYVFTFVAGSLHISGGQAQTITFPPLPSVTYGQVSTVHLAAATSSNQPITYTLGAGSPALLAGSTLTITGAGSVSVTANQYGGDLYVAATPVTQSFTVAPAALTVAGPAVSLPYGTAIDATKFPASVVTGFVNGDTAAVLTGTPAYSVAFTGVPHSGTSFPVAVASGSLQLVPAASRNYVFATFVPGTLTIVQATQTISFDPIADTIYEGTLPLNATSRDANGNPTGLPVSLSFSRPVIASSQPNLLVTTAVAPSPVTFTAVGPFTVTAAQIGSTDYLAAVPVSQSINVGKAPLKVTAANLSREFGDANPAFTFSYGCPGGNDGTGCFLGSDAAAPNVLQGTPTLSTDATTTSFPGDYVINVDVSGLTSANYVFVPQGGKLTITPAGSYVVTPGTTTVNVPSGESRQVSITLASQNLFEGTISLSCGMLPANVSCHFSPATYTFSGADNAGGNANDAAGTLTITTLGGQSIVAGPWMRRTGGEIAFALLPGCLLAIGFRRSRLQLSRLTGSGAACLVLLLIAGLGLSGCGSGSNSASSKFATPGTYSLTILATGTPTNGSAPLSKSATISLVVQ